MESPRSTLSDDTLVYANPFTDDVGIIQSFKERCYRLLNLAPGMKWKRVHCHLSAVYDEFLSRPSPSPFTLTPDHSHPHPPSITSPLSMDNNILISGSSYLLIDLKIGTPSGTTTPYHTPHHHHHHGLCTGLIAYAIIKLEIIDYLQRCSI